MINKITKKSVVFHIIAVLLLGVINNVSAQNVPLSTNGEYILKGHAVLSDAELEKLLSTSPGVLDIWGSAKTAKRANLAMRICSPALLGASLLCVTVPWFGISEDLVVAGYIAAPFFAVAGIVAGVMIPVTKNIYSKRFYKTVDYYNRGVAPTTTLNLNVGTTSSGGMGFELRF